LFDFPPPNISAEKRFTTVVPLQRLFLMNSDFTQLEAEALYKRVAAEPDNRARIRKLYTLVYGREPKETEIQLGLDYLKTEPMREYEEGKKKAKEKAAEGKDHPKPAATEVSGNASGTEETKPITAAAKPAAGGSIDIEKAPEKTAEASADMPMPDEAAKPDADPNAGMGMGMMAGVPGRRGGPPKPVEIKYEPTTWGRYAKLLLSSSEFIFIN
jgi:hypothetical protein